MKEVAIIGPTASGKSDLAIRLAQKHNASILSLDSLSIYKEIDIASAKPSKEELALVPHFGIDLLYPHEEFNAALFIDLYEKVRMELKEEGKNLIIVGGTGFYLKSLMEGLSDTVSFSTATEQKINTALLEIDTAYETLNMLDPQYCSTITHRDSFRIGKGLGIYYETGITPSRWFQEHPRIKKEVAFEIYEIDISRELLRERIKIRTHKMAQIGLVDEICYLERTYGRASKSLQAIGIKEVFAYLDGYFSFDEMLEQITIHTGQLAKRQQVFNKSQFKDIERDSLENLEKNLEKFFGNT